MTLSLRLRREIAARLREGWAGLLWDGAEVDVPAYARRAYRLDVRERDGLLVLALAEPLRFGPLPQGVSTDGWALYGEPEGGEAVVTGAWTAPLETRVETEVVVPPDAIRVIL